MFFVVQLSVISNYKATCYNFAENSFIYALCLKIKW